MLELGNSEYQNSESQNREAEVVMSQNIVMLIDATDDQVVITARKDKIPKVMDLSLLRYIEIDGFIRAEMHDPVPHRGRQVANARLMGHR